MIAVIALAVLSLFLYFFMQKHFHGLYCGEVARAQTLKRRLDRLVSDV